MVSMKNNEPLHNELEFKPSFDQYLKAMESVKNKTLVKKGHEFQDDEVSTSRGKQNNKGFRNERKQKSAGSKRRSRSLDSKSDEVGSIRERDNLIKSNLNSGSVVERGVTYDLEQQVVSSIRERNNSRKGGKTLGGGDNFVDRKKAMDRGPGKRYSEIESMTNRNGQRNVKSNGSSKRFLNRGYDSDDLVVERAAFKNLEDPNNVISKAHFSHKEMEERIQKLAKQYVLYSFFPAFGVSEFDKITHLGTIEATYECCLMSKIDCFASYSFHVNLFF